MKFFPIKQKAMWCSLLLLQLSMALRLGITQDAKPAQWLVVDIDKIGVASDDILETAIKKVESENYAGILLKIDSPGGAVTSTKSMVKKIQMVSFPIISWVGPSGSSATSAAAILAISTPIAAMASGTIMGAATPIQATGDDIDKKSDLHAKAVNDMSAFVESIAKMRGRNVEIATSFVKKATSITNEKALEVKVIDLIADSPKDLMQKIHGKTINLNAKTSVTLNTENVRLVEFEATLKHKLLSIVSDPNLFYLFYIAGLTGIGFELTHPGVIFPGVVGVICMILALIGTSVLPISYGAAALILAGVIMMFAEIYVASFGALGIGGFISFFVGSVFLVDSAGTEGLRISIFKTILPISLCLIALLLFIAHAVVKVMRRKVESGDQLLSLKKGKVTENFVSGQGKVRVEGEIWDAKTEDGSSPEKGSEIMVTNQSDMQLIVKPTRIE